MDEPLTPENFRAHVISLIHGADPEIEHGATDEAMENLLISLGYSEGVEEIRDSQRYYS